MSRRKLPAFLLPVGRNLYEQLCLLTTVDERSPRYVAFSMRANHNATKLLPFLRSPASTGWLVAEALETLDKNALLVAAKAVAVLLPKLKQPQLLTGTAAVAADYIRANEGCVNKQI